MASFVTARGEAISLESQTESQLGTYSTFAQTSSSEATSQEKLLDKSIEDLLFKRQEVLEELAKICEQTPSISASKLSQLQRHKEVLQEHWKSFRSIRSSIQQERNRLNLLFSVKNDLAKNNDASIGDSKDRNNMEENDYIQDESQRIDESHNVVDRLISQAWETRTQFAGQSTTLQTANNAVLKVLQKIPGVNLVISKINTRKKKNVMIIASLLTTCILLLFFTW